MDDLIKKQSLAQTGAQMAQGVSEAFHFPFPRKPIGKGKGMAPKGAGRPGAGRSRAGRSGRTKSPFAPPPA